MFYFPVKGKEPDNFICVHTFPSGIFFPFLFLFFYGSIVDLQYYICFRCII